MILGGDIGGTKTVLALFDDGAGELVALHEETYPSRSAASLEELATRFLDAAGRPALRAACFGVAGAVVDGRVKTTNLPWECDEPGLAAHLGVPRVRLLNDLEAAAHGVLVLPPGALHTLQPGSPPRGPATRALIAAGTGLGEAILAHDGARYHILASEGGHVNFGPRSELEARLWAFLQGEFGHVSYERVLSGPGLANVYRFLRRHRGLPEPDWLRQRIAGGDLSAVIAQAALADEDPVCSEALTLLVSIYGAAAGNLALTALATGGLFVGGGIGPKILARITQGPFLEAFRDKGPLRPLMERIPVHVILEPRAPLLGAASCARTLVSG